MNTMITRTRAILNDIRDYMRAEPGRFWLLVAAELMVVVFLVLSVWYAILRTNVHLQREDMGMYPKQYAASENIYAAPAVGDNNSTDGSQHDVDGLYAYLHNWEDGMFNLALESTNTSLDCVLMRLENRDGDVLATFDGDAVLPRASASGDASWEASVVSYSVPAHGRMYEPNNVYLRYRYADATQTRRVKVYAFTQSYEDVFEATNIRVRDNVSDFAELSRTDGVLTLTVDTLRLTKPLFIPSGLTFRLTAGQTIDFCNDSYIMCRSPLEIAGTADKPVTFCSSDSASCAAIVVLQAGARSEIRNLVCDNLSELNVGAYHLTGAVTFYESDVDFYDCRFLNNRSEDGVNTVRCDALFDGCFFYNTMQDAYDSDFCTGVFRNCRFEKAGNDAFDVSTSRFVLSNISFLDIHDKAISVGERSVIEVDGVDATNVQVCIGAKDDSTVTASNIHAKNTFIGFCMYQKKPEFSHSRMTINGYSLEGYTEFRYLIESEDVLVVDGERWMPSGRKKQSIIIERMINEEPIR